MTEERMRVFGELVKRQRRAKGYTQAQVAEQLGLHTKSISYIECGKNLPNTENLFRLALLLEISLDEYLFCEEKSNLLAMKEINEILGSFDGKEKEIAIGFICKTCKALRENFDELKQKGVTLG